MDQLSNALFIFALGLYGAQNLFARGLREMWRSGVEAFGHSKRKEKK